MKNDETVTEGTGNVFADLGFSNPEEHRTKARLVSQIARIMERRKLTQAEAAKLLGIGQPKVSAMLGGRFRGFSVYRLMSFIAALGGEVEIVTKDSGSRTARTEHIGVH